MLSVDEIRVWNDLISPLFAVFKQNYRVLIVSIYVASFHFRSHLTYARNTMTCTFLPNVLEIFKDFMTHAVINVPELQLS